MKVVALAPDLMDQSRIRAAVPSAQHELVFVRRSEELAGSVEGASLVIVDLSRPGALDALGGLGVRSVGFGSHVDRELLAAASAAGCGEVLPRSQFFRRLPEMLSPG